MKPYIHFRIQKNRLCMSVIFVLISVFAVAQQAWVEVPTPDVSETRNMLRDIGGTSSNDVWTVGSYETTPGNLKNLVMHWNGSDWQFYSGTDKSSTLNDLWGVTAIASDDVWAAGAENSGSTTNAQLMHWNGSSWTHTNLPVNPGGAYLDAIDAIATNDIWAVGGQAGSPIRPCYTIHFNGSGWTEVSAPNVGTFRNAFYDVDGIAPDDVWAVGHYGHSYGDFHAMAQHWDGSNWTIGSLPVSVTAPLGGTSAKMQWSTTSESNASEFVMERSQDGVSFIPVNRTLAVGSAHEYELMDYSPLPGVNYYRLKLIDLDGSITLFPMKVLNFENVKAFSLFPNPVRNETVTISLRGEGERHLRLYNHMGQELKRWILNDEDSVLELNMPIDMTSGMYILTMMKGEMVWSEKLIVE